MCLCAPRSSKPRARADCAPWRGLACCSTRPRPLSRAGSASARRDAGAARAGRSRSRRDLRGAGVDRRRADGLDRDGEIDRRRACSPSLASRRSTPTTRCGTSTPETARKRSRRRFRASWSSGQVDRERLGARVLGDAAALQRLEGLVHPAVAEARARFLERRGGGGTAARHRRRAAVVRDRRGSECRSRDRGERAGIDPARSRSGASGHDRGQARRPFFPGKCRMRRRGAGRISSSTRAAGSS